jgi:hypothetical protein
MLVAAKLRHIATQDRATDSADVEAQQYQNTRPSPAGARKARSLFFWPIRRAGTMVEIKRELNRMLPNRIKVRKILDNTDKL